MRVLSNLFAADLSKERKQTNNQDFQLCQKEHISLKQKRDLEPMDFWLELVVNIQG